MRPLPYVCVCVCVCVYTHAHTSKHTHTHTPLHTLIAIPRRPGLDRGNMSDTEQHVIRGGGYMYAIREEDTSHQRHRAATLSSKLS